MKKKKRKYIFFQNKEGEDIAAITELVYKGEYFVTLMNWFCIINNLISGTNKILNKNYPRVQEYRKRNYT